MNIIRSILVDSHKNRAKSHPMMHRQQRMYVPITEQPRG
jgi:hypothetical protein